MPSHFIPSGILTLLFPSAVSLWMGFFICWNLRGIFLVLKTLSKLQSWDSWMCPLNPSFANLIFGNIHVEMPLIPPALCWKADLVEELEINIVTAASKLIFFRYTNAPPLRKPSHQTGQELPSYGVGTSDISFLLPSNPCASFMLCK